MTEAEEIQKIKAVVAKPTEEGAEQLVHLMETSAFNSVKLEAVSAILEIGFGPPSKEANEELAVWVEAPGLDIDELVKKAEEILAELKSRN
jgi:putative heme iron utilization protein